jgi:HEPN domain-containing protein
MPPDADWVRSWVGKAGEDLAVANRLLREPPIYPAIVAFHAQQAAEKFLKAYLVHRHIEFEKAHSIRYLLDLCSGVDKDFGALRDRAEPLTRYAVAGRYPVAEEPIGETEARQAVEASEEVRVFVLKRIPLEPTPDR